MRYFHEEQRFGIWVWAVVAFVVVFAVIPVIGAIGTPALPLTLVIGPGVIALVVILLGFSRLDTDVDDKGIHVAFHRLWATRHIPLDDVKRAHATTYSPLAWGGWGVHWMIMRGWSFNTGGNEGVLVETNSGSNVMIGSQRSKELEAAIAKAIAARAGR